MFTEEDPVFVRNYHQGDKWLPGVISEKTGPVSFKVTMTTGQDRRCHQDQIWKRSPDVEVPNPEAPDVFDSTTPTVEPDTPHQGDKWLPGVISEKTGPVSFKVTMTTGQDRRCHQDQIWKRSPDVEVPNPEAPDVFDSTTPTVEPDTPTEVVFLPPPTSNEGGCVQAYPPVERKIYPSRDRNTVDRYELKW